MAEGRVDKGHSKDVTHKGSRFTSPRQMTSFSPISPWARQAGLPTKANGRACELRLLRPHCTIPTFPPLPCVLLHLQPSAPPPPPVARELLPQFKQPVEECCWLPGGLVYYRARLPVDTPPPGTARTPGGPITAPSLAALRQARRAPAHHARRQKGWRGQWWKRELGIVSRRMGGEGEGEGEGRPESGDRLLDVLAAELLVPLPRARLLDSAASLVPSSAPPAAGRGRVSRRKLGAASGYPESVSAACRECPHGQRRRGPFQRRGESAKVER